MKTVTLDFGEMAVVSVLAAMRQAVNRSSQVENRRIGPQSDYQTEVDGLVAELAFCKWKNICPDMTTSPRSGGADCVVNGWSVDVKATRRQDGRLLAVMSKNAASADIYVLAVVNDNSARFAGWAFTHELIDEKNKIDLGHGDTYALEQSKLRRFKDESL